MYLGAASPFWSQPNGSADLWIRIGLSFLLMIGIIIAMTFLPTRMRRSVTVAVTFLAGLFYVVYHFWPRPIDRQDGELAQGAVESVSFWLEDSLTVVANFTNILSAFLIGLGIYSLVRIHGKRLFKMQKDWFFSLVLLASMVAMAILGYADWMSRLGPDGVKLANPANWGPIQISKDLLFDGLLQQMDAAMFSLIAFYILSAAYRAFRIRSVESTILLGTALIVIFSLMGMIQYSSDQFIQGIAGKNPDAWEYNFTLTSIAGWIQNNVQTPAIRGIDFGIGIGALAMGLRLWLSLERAGASG